MIKDIDKFISLIDKQIEIFKDAKKLTDNEYLITDLSSKIKNHNKTKKIILKAKEKFPNIQIDFSRFYQFEYIERALNIDIFPTKSETSRLSIDFYSQVFIQENEEISYHYFYHANFKFCVRYKETEICKSKVDYENNITYLTFVKDFSELNFCKKQNNAIYNYIFSSIIETENYEIINPEWMPDFIKEQLLFK